mgnify:FL=1
MSNRAAGFARIEFFWLAIEDLRVQTASLMRVCQNDGFEIDLRG